MDTCREDKRGVKGGPVGQSCPVSLAVNLTTAESVGPALQKTARRTVAYGVSPTLISLCLVVTVLRCYFKILFVRLHYSHCSLQITFTQAQIPAVRSDPFCLKEQGHDFLCRLRDLHQNHNR